MKPTLSWISCFFLIFQVVSCNQNEFRDKQSLTKFLHKEENGLVVKKKVNECDLTLLAKPTDLIVLQELGDSYSEEDVQRLREKYDPYLFFILSISCNNKELLDESALRNGTFSKILNTLSFDMGERAFISTGKDSIFPVEALFSRSYGMSPSSDILFAFSRNELIKENESIRFVLSDLDQGFGELSFRIKTKVIKDQPSIKFQY